MRRRKHSVSPMNHFHMERMDNSLIPSALSKSVVSPDGPSSAKPHEKGEVLFFPHLLPHSVPGLLPACCSLLWLCCLADTPVSQFRSAEDMAQSTESAQGKVLADAVEVLRRSSSCVGTKAWDKASS